MKNRMNQKSSTRSKVQVTHEPEMLADSGLTGLEEAIIRMRQGEVMAPGDKIERKTLNPELYQKLLEMELRAFEMTGALEGISGKTEETNSVKIAEKIQALKK